MNLAQKIAKESTITFSGLVYGNINRYLYTALLARWVGVEYLGIYSLANSIILIAEVMAKMGLETGVMRFVSRLDPKVDRVQIQNIVSSALKMTGIFSVGIMLFILAGSGWFVYNIMDGTPLLHAVLIVFALTMPFSALTLVSAFATQGFKLMKYKAFATQFVNPTVLLGVMVMSFWFISKEVALMLPMAMAGVVGSGVMFFFLKKLSGVGFKDVVTAPFSKPLLAFSYPLMFVTILQTFMHWMDILMLGYFTNASIVGLYHPAARTAGLLQALLFSFISIYAPILSQLHGQGKTSEMSHLYRLVARWLTTFAIPISLIFLLYPEKVMLLFGSDYVVSAPVLVVLTFATFIQAATGAAGPALSMSGHTHLFLWNSLGAFIMNIILNIILIPRYGIIGAAWATLFSLTAIGLARVIEVRLIMKMSFFHKGLFKPVLAGGITWWMLLLIRPIIMNYHTLVTLPIACIVSVTVFGAVLWVLKFEQEDKDFWIGLGLLKKSITK